MSAGKHRDCNRDWDIEKFKPNNVVDEKYEMVKNLNLIILSMAAKQRIFDEMESSILSLVVYTDYIDILIDFNIKLLGLSEPNLKEKYKDLIEKYLNGKINKPDALIEQLQRTEL